MAEPLMLTVLRKVELQEVYESFEREAITPDIISLLSKQNLQFLGIPNATDMMRLRAECVKYGKSKPQKIGGYSGAPKFDIDKLTLDSLLDCGFQISDIAKLLLVSERTIYRRMAQFGLSKQGFSEIDDGDLERVVSETIKDFPMCGEQMLRQLLRTKGLKIQRWRLRDCIHEIDSSGVRARKAGRLHRRTYNVMAPNHLWHIDTNHKLIRWRFVIIGGIDGFSRMIMFLSCNDNNTSKTVLESFLTGVDNYGIPLKVRSDKGRENVSVADFMLTERGESGMITGPSTHNQRIERLWRDIFEGVLCYFYNLFYYMEDHDILDPLNDLHLAALHYNFKDEINRRLNVWSTAWGCHRIRTVKATPLQLWGSGQVQNPVGMQMNETELPELGVGEQNNEATRDGERPIFQPLNLINEQCREILNNELNRTGENFGIDDYLKSLEIISANN